MSLILAWVLFPLVLAVVGAGWGTIVEGAAGALVDGALLLPLGLAAALVVAGTLTAFTATAPAAAPVVAVGAVAGLVFAWPGRRLRRWALLAAVGVLLVYGAPVLASGSATLTGFIKLDDTATWLNIVDHVMSHARSVSGEPASTYSLLYSGDVGPSYPLGAFMLLGVGHALTGIDSAWIIQPYMACCAAAVALCVFALTQPLIASQRIRALVAFLAAQSALLYGYSLWGGIKELTAAFLLVLGVAVTAAILPRRRVRPRELLPLAVAAGALIQTVGAGAAAWVVPAFALVALIWLVRGWRAKELWASATSLAWLTGLTAAFVVPVWLVLKEFLGGAEGLFSAGQSTAQLLGNLTQPVSGFQLAGIWPVGDFRHGQNKYLFVTAPTLLGALVIGLAAIAVLVAFWVSIRRRRFDVILYVALALGGCAVSYFSGATPWVTGKALASSSPALLAAALTGGGVLWSMWNRHRAVGLTGMLLVAALGAGVLWSSALQYHDATLAPRARLADLQHIGELVAGKGPTFINVPEIYADRHFLRAGYPVEPAEYRPVTLAVREGGPLTKGASADLDSFPLSTLEPYRSLVVARTPAESRPPSTYHLVWQSRYYQLWQRPEHPATRILEHVPLGESNALPYCGPAQSGESRSPCSIDPVAVPACSEVRNLGRRALAERAGLLAYQRPPAIYARGDQTLWPAAWLHTEAEGAVGATSPGELTAHIAVNSSQKFELWLYGSFDRGFEASVDGSRVGEVSNQLFISPGYARVGDSFLEAGVHTIVLTYPHADPLTPGSGDEEIFTSLSAIVLQPKERPPSELIAVAPQQATRLCGRSLDWIEIVAGA